MNAQLQEIADRIDTSVEELVGFLRRQLWIADGGEKERRFNAALDELIVEDPDGGYGLAGQTASPIGIVSWVPSAEGATE